MNYTEATHYLLSLGNEIRSATALGVAAAKLGLENISTLLEDLGCPQKAYPSVLVAGTNGKGSVAAMLEAVLRASGLRTGLYISPHLVEITERIQVLGEPIPPIPFADEFSELHGRIERLLAAGTLRFHPTYFECLTALAMEHFRRQRCEFVVLEVGMGGRLDATNTVTPCACVITQIDFDHERFLGSTIEAIASEKAGIIKKQVPVISTASHPAAAAVIRRTATQQSAPLTETWNEYSVSQLASENGRYRFLVSHPDGYSLRVQLALRGRHQVENAVAVVAAARTLRRLGFPISDSALQQGLAQTSWPGRLELIHEHPAVFLDGAHNPAGARALASFWDQDLAGRCIVLVYGAMRDKAVSEIAEILFPRASRVILTQPDQPRAAAPATLRDLCGHLAPDLLMEPVPAEALARALSATRPEDVIFVTGSLYLVGDIKRSSAFLFAQPSLAARNG